MVLTEHKIGAMLSLTICRAEDRNAINRELLEALRQSLARAESDERLRVVAIHGQPGVFCTGTDFGDAPGAHPAGQIEESARLYFRLLQKFSESSKILVAVVDGETQAGGVGLVAACDHVICSESSSFRLPETLLGLLPACVIPFLARRIGLWRAYRLALTAATVNATEAHEAGLVDQVAYDCRDALRRFAISIDRAPLPTLARLKQYVTELSRLPADAEDRAVACIAGLLSDPGSAARVKDLMQHGLWQRANR